MKYKRYFFISAVCLLLLGCAAPAAESEYTPTAESAVDVTESAAQPPTATPTAATPQPMMTPTITKTPTSTPVPTETPDLSFLHTPTPTPTPRPFAAIYPALPPPSGQIFIVWNPSPKDQISRYDHEQMLYSQYFRLTFEPDPNFELLEPDIQPKLIYPQRGQLFSPDESKMILMVVIDTNETGKIEPVGTSHNPDVQVLYMYDLEARTILPLVTSVETGIHTIAWLPNSQGFLYTQRNKLILHRLQNASEEIVLELPSDAYLTPSVLSPDGKMLVLSQGNSDQIIFFDIVSMQIVDILDDASLRAAAVDWSADSKWVSLPQNGFRTFRRLSLYNIVTQQFVPSIAEPEDSISLPAWSPNGRTLAFTRNDTILSLWDSERLTTTDILTATHISAPMWTDDQRLMVGVTTDSGSQIMALDIETGEQQVWSLDHGYEIEETRLLSWSPDGNWLAFMTMGAEGTGSGVYLVPRNGEETYLLLDMLGYETVSQFEWVSNLHDESE